MRYLLFLIVGIIVVLLWRASMRRPDSTGSSGPMTEVGEMVQCRKCGVYLPKEEAIADGPFFFCSVAHRDADRT